MTFGLTAIIVGGSFCCTIAPIEMEVDAQDRCEGDLNPLRICRTQREGDLCEDNRLAVSSTERANLSQSDHRARLSQRCTTRGMC